MFGKLISRWPVAGGVIIDQDTVYAAAGITHYDGTFVVALDALTGQLKACNAQSGKLSPEVNGGISLQGDLAIVDGELHFLGGGVYQTARYALKSLACLNEPKAQVFSQYQTAFYPYYPTYGKYVSLHVDCGDGTVLNHEASYEGSTFQNLALKTATPGEATPKTERAAAARSGITPGTDIVARRSRSTFHQLHRLKQSTAGGGTSGQQSCRSLSRSHPHSRRIRRLGATVASQCREGRDGHRR